MTPREVFQCEYPDEEVIKSYWEIECALGAGPFSDIEYRKTSERACVICSTVVDTDASGEMGECTHPQCRQVRAWFGFGYKAVRLGGSSVEPNYSRRLALRNLLKERDMFSFYDIGKLGVDWALSTMAVLMLKGESYAIAANQRRAARCVIR